MKIGIITFHFPYNCGAVLQCLALQTKLEQLGHEVEIINYQPWYHKNRYTPRKMPGPMMREKFQKRGSRDFLLIRTLRAIYVGLRVVFGWRKAGQIKPLEAQYSSFRRKYLKEGPVYRTLRQLQKNPPQDAVYIAGSDQLWNPSLTAHKLDLAYMLDFGGDVRRMTYAMGVDLTEMDDSLEVFGTLLQRLDAISLREERYAAQIVALGIEKEKLHIDTDPTLFHSMEFYQSLIPERELIENDFVLMYVMPDASQEAVLETVRTLAKQKGCAIVDVCGIPNEFHRSLPFHRSCGPDAFLWYLQHARYVVTNSFHGTVFSLIFHKDFAVIPHQTTGFRVSELLTKVGAADKICHSVQEALEQVELRTDYGMVDERIRMLTRVSEDYLSAQLK